MRLPCTIVEDAFDIDFSAQRASGEIVIWGINLIPADGKPVEVPPWLEALLRDHIENHPDLEEEVANA